jgi:hypothetical protein
MGRSTSLRVAAWDEASPPHDQHTAKHRQGGTGPAFLALPIPLHDPGTPTRPPILRIRQTLNRRMAPAVGREQCRNAPARRDARHLPRAIADSAASIEG